MGVATLLADVVDGYKVGMSAKPGHGLRLEHDAFAGQVVQSVGAYLRKRDVAVERDVVGQEDALASALAKEPLDAVSARYER